MIKIVLRLAVMVIALFAVSCSSCNGCSGESKKNDEKVIIHSPIKWDGYKDNVKLRSPDKEACAEFWEDCLTDCMEKIKMPKKKRSHYCYKLCAAKSTNKSACSKYRTLEDRLEGRENNPYQEVDPRNELNREQPQQP